MEFTSSAVARHNSIKDLYLILHDKVYDCSSFVTDHPYVARSWVLFSNLLLVGFQVHVFNYKDSSEYSVIAAKNN